jgi:ATP-dependent DNA ligase
VLPRIQPMRLRITKPFDDPDYIFELKHDGFRVLACVEEGKCKLVSRNSRRLRRFATIVDTRSERRVGGKL